jgi:DNA-binding NarL/FixJ family response regulator/phosphopantetheine adenylyltransferase
MSADDVRVPQEREPFRTFPAARVGAVIRGTFRHLKKGGEPMDIDAIGHLVIWRGRAARLVVLNDITERKRTQRELEVSEERLRALSRRLLEVQEGERGRLARDLHDDVGQALTALKIQLESLARVAGRSPTRVDEMRRDTRHTLERVRQLSLMLRPLQLDDLGLVAALRSHLDRQASIGALTRTSMPRTRRRTSAPRSRPRASASRRKAITNVLRHAGARNLWLRLFTSGEPSRAFGARRRRRVRSGSRAAPRRGGCEPRPGRHGGARGARGRSARAALGARTGHGIAGNIRAGPRRKGSRTLIRVVLADDHALVRAGHPLAPQRDARRRGGRAKPASGEEALEIASREQPDVVLMDIAMKGITGLEAAARMRDQHPGVRVIILSMHSGEEYVLQALRAGAVGYLLKDAATGELELALRTVIRGESWLSPAVSRQVVEGYVQRVGGDAGPDVLTARQREVLRLVAGGKSTKEIAFALNLSVKTVETHRAQIMERLGIRDVAGLVRYALRTGLIPPEG